MKQIFKNFIHVTKRFKTSSILNLLGLSAAFTVFIVVMMQVYYDFSFDKFHEKSDKIYITNRHYEEATDERMKNLFTVNPETGQQLAAAIPEIKNYCLMNIMHFINSAGQRFSSDNTDGSKNYTDANLITVNTSFADMFTINVLQGDAKEALSSPNKVMIPKSFAIKHFGTANAMGKNLTLDNSYFTNRPDILYTVSAIYNDFPTNSVLKNQLYTQIPENNREMNYLLFLEVDPKDVEKVKETAKEVLHLDTERFFGEKMEEDIQLRPFTDINFADISFISKGNKTTTLSLLAIAVIALIIAYINFINFSVAMTPARIKTINLQKILGAESRNLQIAISFESVVLSFFAFLVALVAVCILGISPVQDLFTADLSLFKNIGLILLLGVSSIVLAFILGMYPARYMTSTNSLQAISNSTRSSAMRNVLITLQFLAAIFLIITASFIKMQHDYVVNYEWGLEKENVAYVKVQEFGKKNLKVDTEVLSNEFLKNSSIKDVTTSSQLPGYSMELFNGELEGKKIEYTAWSVKDNFLSFMGIPLADGENFISQKEGGSQIIFNETLVKEYDLNTKNLLGQMMPTADGGNIKSKIVGVAKDINFESLYTPIRPMAFYTRSSFQNYLLIKIDGTETKQAIKQIEGSWNQFSDQPLDLHFLDDEMENLYQADKNLGNLLTLFSIIAIAIAIMGVYGLITFNSRYRAREIAVRKVNGADEKEIIIMLNKGAIIQLLIGFAIATPLAYYVVSKWLEQFAYKIDIHWWVFALGALLILLITILTVSAQSYRAATANPVKALKSE